MIVGEAGHAGVGAHVAARRSGAPVGARVCGGAAPFVVATAKKTGVGARVAVPIGGARVARRKTFDTAPRAHLAEGAPLATNTLGVRGTSKRNIGHIGRIFDGRGVGPIEHVARVDEVIDGRTVGHVGHDWTIGRWCRCVVADLHGGNVTTIVDE
jgi:hypothetical protein